jgi:hypothetical protein
VGARRWLRFLELSIRVDAKANLVAAKQRFEESLRDRGLTIDAEQDTKTSKVLERLVKAAADPKEVKRATAGLVTT